MRTLKVISKSFESPLAKALERGFRGEVCVKFYPPPLNAVHQLSLKMRAMTAAAEPYGTAVALAEHSATIASFQR